MAFKCSCGSDSKTNFETSWRERFPKLSEFADNCSDEIVTARLYEQVHGKMEEKKVTKRIPDMVLYLFQKLDEALEHNNLSHALILQVETIFF